MKTIKLFFDEPKEFTPRFFSPLIGMRGLYLIFSKHIKISYPFNQSRLLYIGMSEKQTNSIGKRLTDHFDGKSGNIGIANYKKIEPLFFTYIDSEMLKNQWSYSVEDLESYFILDFVKNYGVYPICNNKSSFEILKSKLDIHLEIEWSFFE
jgi:hypothetical protein